MRVGVCCVSVVARISVLIIVANRYVAMHTDEISASRVYDERALLSATLSIANVCMGAGCAVLCHL